MRYLSLFSGIEAASVAWKSLGWECAAVAEIEPFPCAVLAHHYPDVPNLGDVSRIGPEEIAALGRIDLVVFGSPCQDLSVAGKRKGLAGERSGLFHVAMDIVRWAREFSGCRWALWENVPGAFSSNKGRDFAAVVEQMAGLDDCPVPPKGWGTEGAAVGDEAMVEWAVLDAQWFGVAQRRRRVFALADFGDWANRPPVLLEPQSLRGDTAPSRTPGQGIAADAAPSLTASGRGVERTGESRGQDPVVAWPAEIASTLTFDFQASGVYGESPVAATLSARDYKSAKDLAVDVPHPITLAERGRDGGVSLEWRQDGTSNTILTPSGGRGGTGVGAVAVCATGEVFHALTSEGFDASEDGTGRGGGAIAIQERAVSENPDAGPGGKGWRDDGAAYTLEARTVPQAVAWSIMPQNSGRDYKARAVDVAQPLMAGRTGAGGNQGGDIIQTVAFHANAQADQLPSASRDTSVTDSLTCSQSAAVATTMQVRRLTPVECARLQGFPDDYLDILYRNKPAADGPRYKALGNSFAVPVVRWIGQRIDLAVSDLV